MCRGKQGNFVGYCPIAPVSRASLQTFVLSSKCVTSMARNVRIPDCSCAQSSRILVELADAPTGSAHPPQKDA
jgi:hypothetical protein